MNALRRASPALQPSGEAPQGLCFQASPSLIGSPSRSPHRHHCLLLPGITHIDLTERAWFSIKDYIFSTIFYRDLALTLTHLLLLLSLEIFENVGPDLRDINPWVPTHHGLSVWSNKELLKVPLDVTPFERLPEKPVCGIPKALSNRWTSVLKTTKRL